jgi:hypothetical protein
MNKQTESLANIWANRRAEDPKLGIVYTFSEPALETFAEQIRVAHTQSVVQLCARTINNNLNTEKQRQSNRWDLVSFVMIVVSLIAWGTWWYNVAH